ncbi:MAG: hypothetical protein GY737_19265 [Desulfobacteraceae bacterium]|nr:hypothetical protein [Desulfobacteraceae bacterium]
MKPRDRKNPLQHDGLARPERFLPELDPGYAGIDDRDIIDLLAFAYKYSRHLRYYETVVQRKGEKVLPTGTWQELLVNEQLFFLAVMAKSSLAAFSRTFEKAAKKLTPGAEEAVWNKGMKDGYFAVAAVFTEVGQWPGKLPKSSRGYQDTMVYVRQMEEQAVQLLKLFQGSFPGDRELWDMLSKAFSDWDPGPPPNGMPGNEPAVDQKDQVRMLRRLFEAVQNLYSSIVLNAGKIIEEDLNNPGHQAHVGLLLSFLHLFAHSLDQLNGFTGRHLDFYLKDILKLVPGDRKPDQAHLIFEPAKGIKRHQLPSGTAFKGGKDTDKTERIYELSDNTVITRAYVKSLKNIYVEFNRDTGPPALAGVHMGVAADTRDGQGEALKEDDPKWQGFGNANYPFAPLGFAVSSPLLRLKQGDRTIKLEFFVDDIEGLKKTFAKAFSNATGSVVELPPLFSGYIYSEKGWIAASPALSVETGEKKLIFLFQLGMGAPGIVDYNPSKSGDDPALPAAWPLIKLLLHQEQYPMALNTLGKIQIAKLHIHVKVGNVTDLVLQNDLSTVKPSKPFPPFGPLPRPGSRFHVGSHEIFAKPLTQISIAWDWVDAPKDLGSWFMGYTDKGFKYKADIEIRKDHQWTSLAKDSALSVEAAPPPAKRLPPLAVEKPGVGVEKSIKIDPGLLPRSMQPKKTGVMREPPKELETEKPKEGIPQFINEFTLPVTGYTADYDAESFTELSGTLGRGGIRFTLTEPLFAFGHKEYGKLHSKAVAASITDPESTLLNELQLPYTPIFENLRLGYCASHTFDLSMAQPLLDIILLHPFGFDKKPAPVLLPDYDGEGYLVIGLKDLVPPQNLSLLVQFAEGSADPFISRPDTVAWACLTASGWTDLTPREILRDTTLGFLQSGMIEFSLPEGMTGKNSVMPTGTHWLRVKVSNNTTALNDLISIRAQAGMAVYKDTGAAGSHLSTALPPASIAKFLVRDKAVKSVTQPFASSGGRQKEDLQAFRMRSSERMRHKNRAVTLWDYEHLVLDLFPGVHKVKCLNHTSPGCEARPGHVTLVLIPDLSNRNSRYPLRPAVTQSVLEKVEKAMANLCSPQVTVHAVNPYYESIQVEGRVYFHPGYDLGLYQECLHRDIREGLTPWLSGKPDIHFGGRIHKSVILNLIEELPYVDYITDFSINHFAGPGDVRMDVEEVVALTSRSILVSHNTHTIMGVKP